MHPQREQRVAGVGTAEEKHVGALSVLGNASQKILGGCAALWGVGVRVGVGVGVGGGVGVGVEGGVGVGVEA